jgi:putative peptidoglycan lipid II flippase
MTRVIYEGKAFDAMATTRVGRAVACYAVGLGFFGLQKTLVPWFQAQKDMKTPLAVSVKMVFLNATLNILAVLFLPEEWRHVGLAASTVFCAGVACVWLAVLARRKNGALGFASLARPVGRTLVASAVMGVALWLVRAWLGARGWTGTWANVTQLGTLVALGGAIYFGTHFLFARRTFAARLRALRKRR